MNRMFCSFAFTAMALVMSCAANPNAPSPVKEDPPTSSSILTVKALFALNAVRPQGEADAGRASLHHPALY